MVNGFQYLGGLIGGPIIGYIADKTRKYKQLAVGCCALAIIANCVQPFISMMLADRTKNTCPINVASGNVTYANDDKLFYSLVSSAIFASTFEMGAFSFIDSGVVQRMQAVDNDAYGRQRLFGSIGSSVSSTASGLFIQYFPRAPVSCYSGIFISYAVFGCCMLVTIHFLFQGLNVANDSTEEESTTRQNITASEKNVQKMFLSVLKRRDFLFFLFNVLFNGTMQGVAFSFTYIYVKEINAPTMIIPLGIFAANCSAIVVYYFGHWILKHLGGPKISICIAWFFMAIRCFATAYIWNPYFLMFPELLQGPSFSLFWISCVEYVEASCDERVLTAVFGVTNSLFIPCSYFIANVVGGWVYEVYGGKVLFVYCALFSAVWAMVNFVYAIVRNKRIFNE